ncbi:MAG: hypothetical protein F4X58_07585 [Chloroflexi bacterium]|nr:hypothetical protein [Chloroflexota bacterium]MYC01769.1 hypothetical protein [Chloroflexota bacterium]
MESHPALSEEQEARRRDGLRILARIIARQYLEQPRGCAADREAAQAGDLECNGAPKSKDEPMSTEEQE